MTTPAAAATPAPFSAAEHVASLARQRWTAIAPQGAKALDEHASLKALGTHLRDVVPQLFRECVFKLAQRNLTTSYKRALTEAEQRREDYTMQMMNKTLDKLFMDSTPVPAVLTLKNIGKHLQELQASSKTYANTPNEFPWGPLGFVLKFLMTQNGGSQVSCLYFSVAMVLLRLNVVLNASLIEACLQLALVANPNNFQAIAQWGHVMKAVSAKHEAKTDGTMLYCFQVAALVEESLKKPGVGCVYGHTLRGVAEMLYRCATRLPSVERRGVLKAAYTHLKRVEANEQSYIHGLRALGCVCLQLGGKYEAEGVTAFEEIAGNVKSPAKYREGASNVLAEVRKGVPLVRIVMTPDWEVLAP